MVAGNKQVTVNLLLPTDLGGSSISNVLYTTNGGTTWVPASPAVKTGALIIKNLVNGTSYSIAVRALTAAGQGTPTTPVSVTPMTVPGKPTITSVVATRTQLTINFTKPTIDGGSAITNYTYTVNGTTWIVRTPASTVSPIVVTGLSPSTSYSVKIAAVNSVGSSLSSTAKTAKTLS